MPSKIFIPFTQRPLQVYIIAPMGKSKTEASEGEGKYNK